MYKLMVVAGPNRGTSYPVEDGETSIGRQSGNSVVLQSSRVSKRHCVLVARDGELVVQDQGSSNGTFVNGQLSKEKRVRPGDRISVGEYVFEVVEPRAPSTPLQLEGMRGASVIPFPGASTGIPGVGSHTNHDNSHDIGQSMLSAPAAPKTPQEKALFVFEHWIMPFFYGMGMKNQWRMICLGVFAAFAVANLFVSIGPLLQSGRDAVVRETARRATFMARQIADQAAPMMAGRNETKVEIGAAESAEGVRVAVVTDMESRIIAPSSRMNQYLTTGSEAVLVTKMRELFRGGRETGLSREIDDETVASVEPVKVYNQQTGKNLVIGMAVVSIDTTIATMGFGDIGLVYSESLILTALIGALALLIMYRLTLKPLQILGDDMDKVLKGDMGQVTHEFKMEELNPLWDLINSALQRVPKSGAGFGNMKAEPTISSEDFVGPMRTLGSAISTGLVVFDGERKILSINPAFEEMSGIRNDNSVGQDYSGVARDQGEAALVMDLLDRAQPGQEGSSESYDFSGVAHKVSVVCLGAVGAPKCYLLIAVRFE
jgi:PAS domain-containing protein